MQPIDLYRASHGETPASCLMAPEDADLNALIDLAVDTENPIVIVDGHGQAIGVVTKQALLRGIQGGEPHGE